MTTEPRFFENDFFYHVYNCGVEKRKIFITQKDYVRFIEICAYYLYNQKIPFSQYQELSFDAQEAYRRFNPEGSENLRVKIISYCFMSNHFHFLLKVHQPNGITQFISNISNSYTRYFNIKNERIGVLLQGTFKAKKIPTEESTIEVTRYIHLNPVDWTKKSNIIIRPQDYPYSSYFCWIKPTNSNFNKASILDQKEVLNWLDLGGRSKK